MKNPFILYGMQASLYTGKVRAYMRRNHIAMVERGAGHPEFNSQIYPQLQRFIIPVLVTPSGDLIQDGTDILDYLNEEGFGHEPLYPDDWVMKAIAFIFEHFGNEGMMKPNMHYRWNFDEDNLEFLTTSFADVLPINSDQNTMAAAFDRASGRMRKAAELFGVTPDTHENIERSYIEFLGLYNAHLSQSYYVLGGAPTIADYGMFNALYAHLARDPKPSYIMKTKAPYVWNWIERMNGPEVIQEHMIANPPTALFDAENLPETLKKLLNYIGEESSVEFSAHIDFANQWLAKQGTQPKIVKPPLGEGIGLTEFQWRGKAIKTAVKPYRFYLSQRLWDHFDGCSEGQKKAIYTLLDEAGLEAFVNKRVDRRIIRKDYQEVWADKVQN